MLDSQEKKMSRLIDKFIGPEVKQERQDRSQEYQWKVWRTLHAFGGSADRCIGWHKYIMVHTP